MSALRAAGAALLLLLPAEAGARTLAEANRELLQQLEAAYGLDPAQRETLRAIFAASPVIGQGNPAITRHPMTREECRERRASEPPPDPRDAEICGGPEMAPLYDPARTSAAEARACIDRFEFPNLPCSYPVVWVRAREAALICRAVGKRLCDAHEWEGACAGALGPRDYRFALARGLAPGAAVARMAKAHNAGPGAEKRWSYGPAYRAGVCAAASRKSPDCGGGEWKRCGSNTYPAGAFPECRSALGVYDLHGNAAEHMNLPLESSQLASAGSEELGYTEMKGSWFIFDHYRAHPDQCRWRAPYWHGSRVMARDSHHNYHLGFRCCRSLEPAGPRQAGSP